jgi:starch synthase
MKILHTTAEFFPFIKVGGLSDMLASLGSYQSNENEVHIAIPLIKSIKQKIEFSGLEYPALLEEDFYSTDSCLILSNSKFLHSKIENINLYFFQSELFANYEKIYTNTDELYSFAIFSYACYTLGVLIDVDVVHAHDWHTSLVSVINNTRPKGKPTVFTIHNLAYQGDHPYWMTGFLKIDPFNLKLNDFNNFDKVNYMKGALFYSQEITTVSPSYRNEVLHEPEGCYLSWILNERADSFTGILNGIDTHEWNPEFDSKIYRNFNSDIVTLGKHANKIELYKEFGLKIEHDRPLVGLIGRLTLQKGFDTFISSFRDRWDLPFYFFVLGSGEESIEGNFFHENYHSPSRIFFYKGFDEVLARKIEAASDFFIMPSLFEPCGLNQLYSHAYGSIPIVSRVGGLRDSVHETENVDHLTGFIFEPGDHYSLNYALARAADLFKRKSDLKKVRTNIMKLDWSWKNSDRKFKEIYQRAVFKKYNK